MATRYAQHKCKNCSNPFRSWRMYDTICYDCNFKLNAIKCEICERDFMPIEKGEMTRCETCQKKSDQTCQYCDTQFVGFDSEYLCKPCCLKRDRIQNDKLDPEIDTIHENYLMKVHYKVTKMEWLDRCCSDNGKPTITPSEMIREFPLLKDFTNKDISENGRILDECLGSKKMLMYKMDQYIGDCGEETIDYRIVRAYVVVNIKIDLGD